MFSFVLEWGNEVEMEKGLPRYLDEWPELRESLGQGFELLSEDDERKLEKALE